MLSLRLRYRTPDGETTYDLGSRPVRIGRGAHNDLVLPDASVSREHCEIRPSDRGWIIHDLGSTNGIEVCGSAVQAAVLKPGDLLAVGAFELRVERAAALAEATLIKRLEEMTPDAGGATLLLPAGLLRAAAETPAADPARTAATAPAAGAVPPAAGGDRGERLLAALLSFAGHLLRTESVAEVLDGVLEAVFGALEVERGFVFLSRDGGGLQCELARFGDRRLTRPEGPLPVSETLLRTVVEQRVALVTGDALADDRLRGGESLRIHQIRSALCAPLWSGERVVGVVQLDVPYRADAFDERDLELVTALANYAAVAVERLRQARRAERERRRRAGLERYHSPGVVEEILRRSDDGDPARALAAVEVSVLFADLVGFSSFSERATPEEVAGLLGVFFDRAVGEIFACGGTLDKFIGDCVMAVFGAPVAQPDHADRAVAAALAIQDRIAEWNRHRREQGAPPVAIRVAINSGPVVAGEIGSERRVDYTVLGDTVNVAARLESAVAGPGEVVIGPRTRELLAPGPAIEELGPRRLPGLTREVAACRVRRGAAGTPTPE